ncbi:chalcone synthase [Hordeum vulgare]|nr:chalcone synthase [Hordeum vulgare]
MGWCSRCIRAWRTGHVSSNVGALVKKALEHAGLAKDWNKELFLAGSPRRQGDTGSGGEKAGLREEKMEVAREVMRQRGNTLSSSVIAVMDEMRRRSEERGLPTAGEGLEWGLLLSFGPGITVETILLRAPPVHNH